MVASLEEAFNTNLQPIRVKSKKNKKKDIIQPEHLKNVNSNEFIEKEKVFDPEEVYEGEENPTIL